MDKEQKRINDLDIEIFSKKREGYSSQLRNLEENSKQLIKADKEIEEHIITKKNETYKHIEKLNNMINELRQYIKKLNNELNYNQNFYDKKIESLKGLSERNKEKIKILEHELEIKNVLKKENMKNYEFISKRMEQIFDEVKIHINKEKNLQNLLINKHNELNEQLNKHNKLLESKYIDIGILTQREENIIIKEREYKLKEQIKLKIEKRNKKIKYNIKRLTDSNEINLICDECHANCHLNCDCLYGLFWNPISACQMINEGKCKLCYHSSDVHKRCKQYYKTIEKERSLSPKKKKDIDIEILELEINIKNIFKIYESKLSLSEKINILNQIENKKMEEYKELKVEESDIKNKLDYKLSEIKNDENKRIDLLNSQNQIENEINYLKKNKANEEEKIKKNIYHNSEQCQNMQATIEKLKIDMKRKIDQDNELKKEIENNLIKNKEQFKKIRREKQRDIDRKNKELNRVENKVIKMKEILSKIEADKINEINNKNKDKENYKNQVEVKEKELKNKLEELKNKKKSGENLLEIEIKNNTNKKKVIKEKLDLIKVDYEKVQNIKKNKEERSKEKQDNEIKIKEEEQNKKNIEEEIKKEEKIIKDTEKELKEKNTLIENKKRLISDLTIKLEDVDKNDQKKLDEEKKEIAKKLNNFKHNAIKEFLKIKIINDEIKNLTLNKDTIYSVSELINELSLDKKFINNRNYFDEIFQDYEKINEQIEKTNGHPEAIYAKYDLNAEKIKSSKTYNN